MWIEDACVLADGSVLAVGIDYSTASAVYAVRKVDTNGDLDTSFGTNGIAAVFGAPPASDNWAGTVLAGPDGRIFVGGLRTYSTQVTSGKGKKGTTENKDVSTGSIVCLNTDGSIDEEFADGGYLDIGWGVPGNLAVRGTASSYDLVMAYGEKVEVEVAGSGKGKNGGTQTIGTSALAIRVVDGFTGANVNSFGTNGVAVDDIMETAFDQALALRIDSLGRIVVLRRVDDTQSSFEDIVVTRHSSTGVLDTTLGTNGRLAVGYPGGSHYMHHFLAIDGDGQRILVAYRQPTTGNYFKTVVQRYATTGSTVDTTFDVPEIGDSSNPDLGTVYDTWPRDLDVDADGKVCVTLWSGLSNFRGTIVRCNANGTRDTGFGPSSDGLTEHVDLGNADEPKAMVIDANGRMVLLMQTAAPIPDVQPYWQADLVRFDG
ncbi:MAG: hypothetical protein R3F05_03830 [Planctomycetota bacterium]